MENGIKIEPRIEEGWKAALINEFNSNYFFELKQFLVNEKQAGITIYPPGPQIFTAFDLTPFAKVKVVLLGQDPYHGAGQAMGLSFSVPPGIPAPPSLVNIFKELKDDLNIPIPNTGDLTPWANQGVFLLNAILTVQAQSPASHQKKGWELFTDAVIKTLSDQKEGLIFLLWGKFAQSKAVLIDQQKHHVLMAPHPSPFSAHSGFFGSKPFSKINAILSNEGKEPINWSL